MAPSARGLRPQAVGERTVRLPEIFRAMARFSPSAPSGHLPRRGRLFDSLKAPLEGEPLLYRYYSNVSHFSFLTLSGNEKRLRNVMGRPYVHHAPGQPQGRILYPPAFCAFFWVVEYVSYFILPHGEEKWNMKYEILRYWWYNVDYLNLLYLTSWKVRYNNSIGSPWGGAYAEYMLHCISFICFIFSAWNM